MNITRTRRRALVATTATLALSATALLGAVAPASAVDPTTITGKVTAPAGADVSEGEVVAFLPEERGFNPKIASDVDADGSFSITGVTPGTGYQLYFIDFGGSLASGYYKAGATEVALPSSASLVRGGASGVTLKTVAGATISGSIVPPSDDHEVSWSPLFPGVILVDPERGRLAGLGEFAYDSTIGYTASGALAGSSYQVLIPTSEDLTGYYYAGLGFALAPQVSGAVSVKAGATGLKSFVVGPAALSEATVSGTAKVGSKLTAGAVQWTETSTSSYQWLRNGAAISGATSSSYTLAAADLGKKVSVRVTAHPSDATLGAVAETSSQTATVVAGPSAAVKSAPKISGTVAVGHKLKASAGSWSLPGVAASYQWLRGGKSISGATSSSYTVSTKDVGAKLSVRVTAKVAGHLSASATSASTKTVAKVKPSVSAKLSKSSAKRTSTVKVTVTVKATGVSKPTGKVTVKVGSKTVTKTVSSSAKGKVTVTLPKQAKKGTYKVSVTYTPSGSTAKVVTKGSASSHKLTLS